MSKFVLALGAFCLAPALASGQTPVVRQEIVVTASRAPEPREEVTSATAVVATEEIERTPAVSAADVLAFVPGIVVFGGGTTAPATLAIRGFYGGGEVEYARLLVDGLATGDVESGLAAWQAVRAEGIERIEVARGVASPLYGDGAFGGVIQLFTRRHDSGDWTLSLGAGSSGTADATAGFWTGQLTVLADVSTSDGDRPHDARRRHGARVVWNRQLGDRLLRLAADHRVADRDDAGPLPLAQLGEDTALDIYQLDFDESTRRQLAATLHAPRWSASVHGAWRNGEGIRSFLLLPPDFADRSLRTIDSRELGTSLSMSRALGAIELRAGFDGALQQFTADYFEADRSAAIANGEAKRDLVAVYATAQVPLGSRMTLTAGARGDLLRDRDGVTSRRASAFSPRLALHVNAGAANLYLAAGGGFKAPTLEQLFDTRPLRLFGSSFVLANADLVPQRARTLEAGIARTSRFGRWQADAYLTRVTNEIDFDPLTFRYDNLRRSEHSGLELLFEPRVAANASLLPRLTYTWMRVASLDDRNAQLKNIPEHSATAMLTAPLPLKVSATALFAWNGSRWLDDANTIAAPDSQTLSLRLARAIGPLTGRVDALNLTDAHNAAAGFVLADMTGAQQPYAWPDARRSLRVSLEWSHRK